MSENKGENRFSRSGRQFDEKNLIDHVATETNAFSCKRYWPQMGTKAPEDNILTFSC